MQYVHCPNARGMLIAKFSLRSSTLLQQVVLKEGENLGALAGLLSSTIVGIKPLSGGGICITLEKPER